MNTNALTGRAGMRALLIVMAVVVVIGAVVFMATSVRWQG